MTSRARRFLLPLTLLICLVGAGSAHATSSTVINTNTSGAGSLAQAITDANSDAAADTIGFNIAGAGVHTIAMGGTSLPQITQPVTINGYTQTTSSANTQALNAGDNAALKIEVSADNTVLDLAASNSTIKGLAVNRGPTPAGGGLNLIKVTGSNDSIEGNFVGLNPAGDNPITTNDTNLVGVELTGGTTNDTIGGTAPAARNVIAGRINEAIRLDNNPTGNTNATIQGNYIGTNPTGTAKPATNPTLTDGIRVFDLNTNVTIGGTAANAGNVIGGTISGSGVGIWVEGTSRVPVQNTTSSTGTIKGNLIGVQRDGTSAFPNTIGVLIADARTWTVGGTAGGEANIIAFNTVEGVEVSGPNNLDLGGDRNRISANSIYGNGSLGIDLALTGQIGRTPNDTSSNPAVQDNDAGPNEQQNFPVLTSAPVSGGSVTLSGNLPSRPSTVYRVEYFASAGTCAANTAGQGQTYLGGGDISTDATGNVTFAVILNGVPAGQNVFSATATDPDGNTSEFSDCIAGTGATTPQCSDGADNDGDTLVDFPNDPGCTSAADDSESPNPAAPSQCSDGLDNDNDGKTDYPADPGCTSAADNTESPNPTTPFTPVTKPPAPSGQGAVLGQSKPARTCMRRNISLVRASRGRRVVLHGLVARSLAGEKVTILGNYGRRKLGVVTPGADGRFTAKVKAPSRRFARRARYRARVGRSTSMVLKLYQQLRTTSVKVSGNQVTVRGKVKHALVGRRNRVVIKRLYCGHYKTVGSARPSRRGTYVVRFKVANVGAKALYRAESRVLRAAGRRQYVKRYARAVGIRLTDETG